MTYKVSIGTLSLYSLTHSLTQPLVLCIQQFHVELAVGFCLDADERKGREIGACVYRNTHPNENALKARFRVFNFKQIRGDIPGPHT